MLFLTFVLLIITIAVLYSSDHMLCIINIYLFCHWKASKASRKSGVVGEEVRGSSCTSTMKGSVLATGIIGIEDPEVPAWKLVTGCCC